MEIFKYLRSVVSRDGREIRRRIQAGWLSWRKISGVLCNRNLSARVKGKMYKCVVRPAIMHGMETVAVTDKQVGKLEVAELKMVRWALGVTREDQIRNEYIRGTARIAKLGEKIRGTRLRWYGHVKRREAEYVGRRTLKMEVPGRRKRGRPRKRWLDVVRWIWRVWVLWRRMWLTEGCGGRRRAVATPNRESRKEKKKTYLHNCVHNCSIHLFYLCYVWILCVSFEL